jgi:hypothetical protein
LMLIGAYRDNEVSAAQPLMRRLEAIRPAWKPANRGPRRLALDDQPGRP